MDGKLRAATNMVKKIESGSIWFLFDEPDSPKATLLEGVSGPGDSGGPAFLDVNGLPHIIRVTLSRARVPLALLRIAPPSPLK